MFAGLHGLQKIFLSRNSIWSIDTSVFTPLHSIEHIYVDDNAIVDMGLVISPWNLNKLTVTELSICGNLINEVIVPADDYLCLEVLLVERNRLTHLPAGQFTEHGNLIEMSFSHNMISDIDPSAFANLDMLNILRLAYNKVKLFCMEA